MTEVLSGIPQGSILGPILFTVFINNLPICVQSCCKVFADDTKIYDSTNNSGRIQEDIIRLQRWSDLWNLYFIVTKCKILHIVIGKNNQETDYKMKLSEYNYDNIVKNEKRRRISVLFLINIFHLMLIFKILLTRLIVL